MLLDSGVARGWKGQTASGGNQEGAEKWGWYGKSDDKGAFTALVGGRIVPLSHATLLLLEHQAVVGSLGLQNLCFQQFQLRCPLSLELTPFWYPCLFIITHIPSSSENLLF